VEVDYYDPLAGAGIAQAFKPNTHIVFAESPGSLTFEVQDIPAIVAVAHERGARVVLDNTWATPLGFRAFDHGVDVSVHAATKYIGGHSDVLLGVIVASEEAYKPLHRLWTDMGVTASSDDCFLALRGLRTLPVRLERAQATAHALVERLTGHPALDELRYPGFGAIISIVVAGGADAAERVAEATRVWVHSTSLGGVESQLERRRRWAAEAETIPEGLVRLSVGLEHPEDLALDLERALEAAPPTNPRD
jgi:cystathionine gamma-synthase